MENEVLRQHVIDELEFEPSIDAAAIGVSAENGIVTLSGHVGSYAERFAAQRAVQRVKGVRGIAQELEVRYPAAKKTADDQIAKRVLDIISWSTSIPEDDLQVTVQKGWVTIKGTVPWNFQRMAAENAARKLSGVVGVINQIELKPAVVPGDVSKSIENALIRNAEIDVANIQIKVNQGTVVLEGRVGSWHERNAAERAAWSVPGVVLVDDKLVVHD